MLLENIEYPSDLPFTLSFSNVAEEGMHYHDEMEVLLILRGTAKCKIHNVLYTLKKGDVLIIDTKDMHRIYDTSKDVLMLDMYIDLQFYTDLYPNIDYMIFACEDYSKNSTLKYQDLQKRVSVLKHHIAKTALVYINEPDNKTLQMDCLNDLIFTLVNQFQGFFIEDNKFKADRANPSDIDLNRLYQIIKYIYLNYDKKITLEDLAEIVYLNPYYISHLIKNTSGLSFQNFLNYVRLEYAEKLLYENHLTLTQISESCGFSSLSYFNKCFRIWYDMTPAEYRKKLVPHQRRHHEPYSETTAMALLESYILASRSQRKREYTSKASHHIFIPVKKNLKAGKPFKKSYPLNISLSSEEDIFMLNYLRKDVEKLKPEGIILEYDKLREKKSAHEMLNILQSLKTLNFPLKIAGLSINNDSQIAKISKSMNISLAISEDRSKPSNTSFDDSLPYTACFAMMDIMRNPHEAVGISGFTKALFTPQGLPTPFYFVHSIFAQIDGNITEERDQYMIIKDEDNIYLLIYQESSDSNLKSHIHISGLGGKHFVIEKIFTKKHNCYDMLQALGNPIILADSIKSHISNFSSGTINLSFIDTADNYDMDFNMEPDSLTFIEIGSLS